MEANDKEGTTFLEVVLSSISGCLANVVAEGKEGNCEESQIARSHRENLKVVHRANYLAVYDSYEKDAFEKHDKLHKCQEQGKNDDHEMIELQASPDCQWRHSDNRMSRETCQTEIIL